MSDDHHSQIFKFIFVFLGILFIYFIGLIFYKLYTYDPEKQVFGNVYKITNISSDVVLLQTFDTRYTTILAIKNCSLYKQRYLLGDQVVSYYNGLDKDGKKEYSMLHKKLCEKVND